MSPEQNIQIARNAYADFLRGDIAAVLSVIDNNIEWITPDVGMSPFGKLRGKSEAARFFQEVNRSAACDWCMIWKIRDGKVTHFQEYTDTAILLSALTAAAAA